MTRNEAPHLEAAREGGYFQLSHSVFRDPELRAVPGDAFRLYLWLSSQGWRFRDSDGSLRASVSFITEALGMPHATVSRGLKLLREQNLIELIETDFKRGNRWRVSRRAAWNPSVGKPSQLEVPRIEAPPSESAAPSNRGSGHLNSSKEPPQFEAEIRKTISSKKSENSLSESLPPAIRDYLEGIKPPLKREREKACLRQLRSAYEVDKIAQALGHLRERGVPGSGEPCHSPMAFLARGMSEVLIEIQRETSAEAKASEKARRHESAETERQVEALRQQEHWERQERAFLIEYPTQESQETAIREWAARLPWKPSNPKATRTLAICSWWQAAQGDKTRLARMA